MNSTEYKKMSEIEDSHFWFIGKRYFVDAILLKHKENINKIIDVGAGTGGMTKHLEKYGNVIGVENSSIAIKLSKRKKVRIIKASAKKIPLKKGSADLVTMFDVLYHKNIKSEVDALNEAHRLLKTGGLLLVTDSAFNFLKSGHDKAVHGKRRYRLPEMINLIEKSGFIVIRKSYLFFSLFPALLIKRMMNRIVKSEGSSDVFFTPILVNSLMLMVIKIEAYLLKYLSFPFGSSVLVFAKK